MYHTLSGIALPIVLRPATPLTDDELMRFSEANEPCKIERTAQGEISVMTPVGGIGSTHEALVAASLYQWNETVQTGIAFLANAGFNLPDGSCLSPDAAWLALDRWRSLTHEERAGYPPLCPDFIIEVRSRTDSRRLLEAKMQSWIDNGAQLAWMIDPIEGDVTIYRPGIAVEALVRPDLIQATDPVRGFELRAARLWTAS